MIEHVLMCKCVGKRSVRISTKSCCPSGEIEFLKKSYILYIMYYSFKENGRLKIELEGKLQLLMMIIEASLTLD